MSSVPSLDFTLSSRDTSDNVEDFSSLGESAEDWSLYTPKRHNADHTSNQQLFPDTREDGNGHIGDLFDTFNDGSRNLPDTADIGAWTYNNQVSGSSAEGSGQLNSNGMQYSVDKTLECHLMQEFQSSARFASFEPVHNAWEENVAAIGESSQTTGPSSPSSSGTASTSDSGKHLIPRCEEDLSNQRWKLRSRLFVCDRCKKTCTRSTDLTRHIRNIHKEGPLFACDTCKRKSRRLDKLMEHCRRMHEEGSTCSKVT